MKILNVASLLKTGIATLLLTFISSPAFSYVEYEDSGYSYNNEEVLNNFYMNFNDSTILPKINSFNAVEDMKGNGNKKPFSCTVPVSSTGMTRLCCIAQVKRTGSY